jgi:hypothetical protein
MEGWKFVASRRHFTRQFEATRWYMHLAFVNHANDFDAIVNVSVEYVRNRKRVAIFGAQLGNIAGVGQTRHRVAAERDIPETVEGIVTEFNAVGMPFLERFSRLPEVLSILKRGGREAGLISPFQDMHAEQIRALEELSHAT